MNPIITSPKNYQLTGAGGPASTQRDLTLINGGAGIQIVGLLSDGKDDVAIAAQAQKKGINLSPLSKYYRHVKPRQGFVLGYAASDERATKAGMQKLREIV